MLEPPGLLAAAFSQPPANLSGSWVCVTLSGVEMTCWILMISVYKLFVFHFLYFILSGR